MIGFSLDECDVLRKSIIEKVVVLLLFDKRIEVYYNNGDICIKKEFSFDNLLELMRDDVLVIFFL